MTLSTYALPCIDKKLRVLRDSARDDLHEHIISVSSLSKGHMENRIVFVLLIRKISMYTFSKFFPQSSLTAGP